MSREDPEARASFAVINARRTTSERRYLLTHYLGVPACHQGPIRSTERKRHMTLGGGERLGPHKILSTFGAGGVVEMRRSRDTRLGCEEAIEIFRRTIQRSCPRRGPCGGCTESRNFCTLHDVGTSYL